MGCRGEYVRLLVGSEDATTAVPLVLFNADGETRPLAADERLLLSDVTIHVEANAGPVELAADDVALAVVGDGTHHLRYGGDLHAGHAGELPEVQAAAAGDVHVTGTGYIIKDSAGDKTRQSWRQDANAQG